MSAKRFKQRVAAISVPVVLGATALGYFGMRGNAGQKSAAPPVQPSAQVLGIQSAFEQVADKLRPSVVFIRSRQTLSGPTLRRGSFDGQDGQEDNPFGFSFPGLPGGGQQFRMMPRRAEASGSGVIVRGDGYILTNDHVVANADRVTVKLQDGREFVGKVYRDKADDLALVKIDATGLPAAELAGNSNDLHIGQWAIAFGAPFGLSDTMTVGVISSLKREETIGSGEEGRLYPSLIQTDASINPGNSGGPLVDVYGRVVGINVAIESPSGGNVGIGFAIPANTARYVMEQLISKGTVSRGFLGLVPQSLDFAAQQQYGVKQGVLVRLVNDNTPAARAGIQVEDIIVRYNGQPVTDEATFRELVSRSQPGERVEIVVNRDGREQTLNATIGSPDQVAQATPQSAPDAPQKARGRLGVSIADATNAEVRQQLHLSDSIKSGAVVAEVLPGSPAAEAGIQPGDVIVRLNSKPIANAAQLSDVAAGLKDNTTVPIVIRRASPQGTQTVLAQINLDQ